MFLIGDDARIALLNRMDLQRILVQWRLDGTGSTR